MIKYKKYLLWTLIALPFVIQLFPSKKDNTSNDETYGIATKYQVSPEVSNLLKVACNDCHSNNTIYPSYANYQPSGWFLKSHINEGKHHLNFSEFTKKRIAIQNHKFEEIVNEVESKNMPHGAYTWFGLHPEAKLSESQRTTLVNWAKAQMDTIKNHYPADSLVLKKR